MALFYKRISLPKFGRATLVLRTHFNYDLTKGKEKNMREGKKNKNIVKYRKMRSETLFISESASQQFNRGRKRCLRDISFVSDAPCSGKVLAFL